uniref:intramembrane prenyl-peptidase Rce1 n=1 Tax=Trypanosoma congolense (strain IL3000) TaxID=1068625 RepID=F9W4Y4_TRYCI|nr:unnamed protein product [Trypanosoma congolense IL3000]
MSDVGICVLLCGGFIGSFYVWRRERTFALSCLKDLQVASTFEPCCFESNNHTTFRNRLISFTGYTGVSLLLLEYLLRKEGTDNTPRGSSAVVHQLLCPGGDVKRCLSVTAKSALATLFLFAGPLLENGAYVFHEDEGIFVLRNLVVCPIGEEVFFRALLLHILLKRRSVMFSVFTSSVLFALSHSHHIFPIVVDEYQNGKQEEKERNDAQPMYWVRALKKLTPMYMCTFACGLLTGYYYSVCTNKNLLATIITHMLCNFIGPPTFRFITSNSCSHRLCYGGIYSSGVVGWLVMLRNVQKPLTGWP